MGASWRMLATANVGLNVGAIRFAVETVTLIKSTPLKQDTVGLTARTYKAYEVKGGRLVREPVV